MTTIPRWRVLLIGAGAVGCVQAGMLAHLRQKSIMAGASEPVPIVHWVVKNPEKRQILSTKGLTFKTFDNKDSVLPNVNLQNMLIYQNIDDLMDIYFDLVIVAVKSFQVASVLHSIKQQINYKTLIVLCNGWLTIKDCLWGLVFGGSYLDNDTVYYSSNYRIVVGSLHPEVMINYKILKLLQNDAIVFKTSDNFTHQALIKLAINSVVNPIATLMLVNNGKLAEPPISVLTNRVISEVENVFQHINYPGVSQLNIRDEIMQVLQHSAANYCSMYQDFINGRPSELNDILNPVIMWGKSSQQDVTHLEWLKNTLEIVHLNNVYSNSTKYKL